MAGIQIRIKGLKPAVAALNRLGGADFAPRLEAAMLRALEPTFADAQRRAPLGKSGKLRRSIHVDVSKYRHPRTYVAVDIKLAPYAYLVEYGHQVRTPRGFLSRRKGATVAGQMSGHAFIGPLQFVQARPYFRPAITAHREQIVADISREITDIYDELLQQGKAELIEELSVQEIAKVSIGT